MESEFTEGLQYRLADASPWRGKLLLRFMPTPAPEKAQRLSEMCGLWNKGGRAEIHCNAWHGISQIKEETEKQGSLVRFGLPDHGTLRIKS